MKKGVICFRSEKALKYLLNAGEVYTLRPKLRKVGLAWVRHKRKKVADVLVEYVGEVVQTLPDDEWFICEGAYAKAKLKDFVDKSGFESVEEWLEEVRRLNGGKLPEKLYLYKVSLLDAKTKIELFAREYEREINRKGRQLLGNMALILVRDKCIATDEKRNFLFMFFPSDKDILPKVVIFHDEKCAYCGKHLINTEEPAKCMLCGKEVEKGLKVTCVEGHYICDKCYSKQTLKVLVPMIGSIIEYYKNIKAFIRYEIEGRLRDVYSADPKFAKEIAFRNAIHRLFKEYREHMKQDLEIAVFTNIVVPKIERFLYRCLECERLDKCESAKDILERLGVEV